MYASILYVCEKFARIYSNVESATGRRKGQEFFESDRLNNHLFILGVRKDQQTTTSNAASSVSRKKCLSKISRSENLGCLV